MRGFSDEERAQIRAQLIEVGREQFLAHGPERTRVKDLTDPVGIAKPTFYQFFDSKGELYLEILARESETFGERLRAEVAGIDDPQAGLERLFTSYLEFLEDSPGVQRMLTEHPPRELFRNVPQEEIDRVQNAWVETYIPAIEALQRESDGPFAERDPEVIFDLLRPVGLMQRYKERGTTRDEAEFERIQRVHVSTLVRGLTCADDG